MPRRTAPITVAAALLVASACATTPGDPSAATEGSPASSTTSPPASTSTMAVPPPPTTVPPPDLKRVVRRFAGAQPVEWSIIAIDLASGARGQVRPDREVWSASLYKLFVARSLLGQIHAGRLGGGAPAGDAGGRTWSECIRAMIVVSDDDCGVAGLRHLGRGAHDAALAEVGFVGTHLDNPQRTTAADVARLLLAVRDRSLLGAGGEVPSGLLGELLARQEVADRLSVGLPPGTAFAHKTGDRTGWAHDAGLVTADGGEYLLVALSGPYPPPCCHAESPGAAEEAAFAAFATLARRVHRTVVGR